MMIDYSYLLLQEYQDLEDGRPNMHHNPALRISGQGTPLRFLEQLSYNSNLPGHSIVEINFKIQEND
jgi:hypothetical protein